MRHTNSFVTALFALLLLSGCSGDELSRSFGLTRDVPDEFSVTTRAPLSMPPDFALRPPRPGANRPQEVSARRAAEAVLAPQAALGAGAPASITPGAAALLQAAGPAAPADIRARVDQDASLDRPTRSLVDRLMFWRDASRTPAGGVAVDPSRESQRLRENAALGAAPSTGETPIIQPRSRGILDRLF